MDGPANTLTTGGAEGTETIKVDSYGRFGGEKLEEASSLSATQFGALVRERKRRYDVLQNLVRGPGKPMNAKQQRLREERFREFEQGQF